jgi:hypothetical protein
MIASRICYPLSFFVCLVLFSGETRPSKGSFVFREMKKKKKKKNNFLLFVCVLFGLAVAQFSAACAISVL